jgi:fumarate reductase subunit D
MLVVNSGKYGCWTIIIIIVVLFLWQTCYQRTHSMWDLSSHSSIGKDGILLGCYAASISRVLQATKYKRRSRDLALLFP